MKEWDMGDTRPDDLATLNFKLYCALSTSCSLEVAVESMNGGESEAVSFYSLNISNIIELKCLHWTILASVS